MIAYEPHPCSQERKAELRAQGFTIVDVAFKPAKAPQEASISAPVAIVEPKPIRKERASKAAS